MDDKKLVEALQEFGKQVASEEQSLDVDVEELVKENLWDLYDSEEDNDE